MPFQNQINTTWAPGVEGSIASANPLIVYATGPGGLISGSNGVRVGRFAFASYQQDGSERADNSASLVAAGLDRSMALMFIANEQQALTTGYLAESGMSVLPFQAIEGFVRGDFWMRAGSAVTRNQKVFASMVDGSMQTAAPGATIATFTGQASFATNVMTVTSVTTGTLKVGQIVTGAGIPAFTYIASFGTGTGGAGTYNLTTSPGTIAAESVTASDYVETKFRALSTANSGELAKIGLGD